MVTRSIIIAPDRRLKVRSESVPAVDDGIRTLLNDMLDTMYAAKGIGLAAIQVGEPKRCIVADVQQIGEPPAPFKLVNPEIIWQTEAMTSYEEGCLSFPEHFANVCRPAEVKITYLDEAGTQRELEASGMLAICLQHEIDHLDGILFVDHLSMVKRSIILRKLSKAQRTAADA